MEPGAVGGRPAGPPGPPGLPSLLISAHDWFTRRPPPGAGLLIHNVGLPDLVRLSALPDLPLAVDADAVEGLAADEAAVRFLAGRLGIAIVITKRPVLATRAHALGCLALLHVNSLDSTGLEHALAAHPGPPVGTAISPGVILPHLARRQRDQLPPPVLAYGLVRTEVERRVAVAAGAAGVVMGGHGSP